MARADETMILGAFFNPTGHHVASWRHPAADADAGVSFAHYKQIARTAERAKFHLLFLADQLSVRDASMTAVSRSAQYVANFEPLTLLSALAAVTEHIGLVATASTSYNEPYHVARQFASLDHISGGRAGWNIVTSGQEADSRNFGRDTHFEHGDRYRRAREFTDVVCGLWDSWDDDAFCRDKASGEFFDPAKLHTLDHRADYYAVKGPLNVPRCPQGYPVLVQAGQSPAGRSFAADYAEIVFTTQPTFQTSKSFYDDIKASAAEHGRDPDDIKVLPGISVVVGATHAEAEAKFEQLNALTDPILARELLSTHIGGFDLSGFPLDGPMPDVPPSNANKAAADQVIAEARADNLTLGKIALRIARRRAASASCEERRRALPIRWRNGSSSVARTGSTLWHRICRAASTTLPNLSSPNSSVGASIAPTISRVRCATISACGGPPAAMPRSPRKATNAADGAKSAAAWSSIMLRRTPSNSVRRNRPERGSAGQAKRAHR